MIRLPELRSDESGVSPVIGVILMVAITVILAAVIAAFVLGFGADTGSAPTASFDSDEDNGNVEFTLQSGDTLEEDEIYVRGDGAGNVDNDDLFGGEDTLSSGESFTAEIEEDAEEGDELNVVWEDGDDSAILYTHEVQEDQND